MGKLDQIVAEKQSEGKNPWEQYPKESAKAFQAFLFYLDSHPRTISAAWRSYALEYTKRDPANFGAPPMYMQVWTRKFAWKERASAHDTYYKALDDEVEARRLYREVKDQRETLSELRQLLQDIAMGRVKANRDQLRALELQLKMCRYNPDHVAPGLDLDRMDHGDTQSDSKVILYLPDNGRGPKE